MKKHLFPAFIMLSSVLACILLFSCGSKKQKSLLKEGTWRGILTLNDSTGLILPFNFDLTCKNDSTTLTIYNAEEKILVDEISFLNDSVIIKMPVFDSEFQCKIIGDSLFTGNWINHSRTEKNIIPFTAIYGQTNRFDCPDFDDSFPFEGRWQCTFGPTDPDSSRAIGVFKLSGSKATGTFLTETGDYRYLEGCVFGKYMLLSGFDGSHAFVFHAEIMEDSTIWGDFYSGIHFQQTWIAWKNDTFKLRNADSLTTLKSGAGPGQTSPKIDFTFSNLENKKVSLSDAKYKNKAVIVQIFGSWCPNCMDETMFLTDLYTKYNSQGLEVIGVAFEKTDDFEKAKFNVNRLKKKYKAEYDLLISGFHPKDADKAFPMVSHIMSFPTTIFIDRNGNTRKIHTGYSGPATDAYTDFVRETNNFVETLLKEK